MSNVFDETSRHRGRWRPAGWAGALALSVVAAGCATSGEETGDPAASSTVILNPGTGETQTESCEATGAQAAFVPPIITFVVDTSGSMGFEMPEGGTRWEVTRRALEDAVAALPEQAAVGVVYYPAAETEEDFCFAANSELFVPLAKLDGQQRDEVAQSLEQTVPRGGTPTHDAYRYALFELGATELDGNRFIVLTTDGAAQVGLRCVNFYDHESMLADVRSGSEKFGVRTFVIGAPGSEGFEDEEFATPDFRAELSELAEVGGTGTAGCSHQGGEFCHFDLSAATNVASDLADALAKISGEALSCELNVPDPPDGQEFDEGRINVTITHDDGSEETLLRDASGACQAGWDFTADRTKIVLCGAECAKAQALQTGRVDILFGCKTHLR